MILRPLTEDDLPTLCTFFASPHVARWWHESSDLETVREKYLPSIRGEEPSYVLLALLDERPVGLAQWYLWDDYPSGRDGYGIPAGAVGIDYLIGHAWDCGRGYGTQVVAALLEATPQVPVWVTPEAANEPSCSVLENNGFTLMAVKQCHVETEFAEGPTALYALKR